MKIRCKSLIFIFFLKYDITRMERVIEMEKINIEELKELFIEIKYGNNIGFEKIYKKYRNLVYGIAFSLLKNKHDSEDIVQIVFKKIYSIDKNKLPVKNEASWLYSVTKNETLNFMKKKKDDISLDDIYEIPDNNNELIKLIDQDNYNRLISKLDNIEKEIVSLKILANFSFEEIAKLLNKPTGTIKWKYYKSINTLKLLLSNLSMFIVTFLSSIVAFKNGKKSSNSMDAEEKQEIEDVNKNEDVAGTPPKEEHKDKNEIAADQETDKQENIIIETPIINNDINCIGVGLMSLSAIFLFITIIFSIIFTKHQLKRRKKLSK